MTDERGSSALPPQRRMMLRTAVAAVYHAPLSSLAVLGCMVIFLGLASEPDPSSWTALSRWGALPAPSIYDGAYWALITSVFVHLAGWHVLFNTYWLWRLGSRLERGIGPWRWLAFFIAAAFVSSALQLASSDGTGIGASGVVYAMLGFLWGARAAFPVFTQVINTRTIQLFLLWLVGGIVVTALNILPMGNVAHLAGLLFGGCTAMSVIAWRNGQRRRAWMLRVCFGILIGAAMITLCWAPWSIMWLSQQAYQAQQNQEYARALAYYTQIIALDPTNAWAFYNRGSVYHAIGAFGKAQADHDYALELDPMVGQQK